LKPASTLKRSFRFGVMHAPTSTFRPVASIGIAKDGGVFISPADISRASWSHGPLDVTRLLPEQDTFTTTAERPKLHYHRSGIVRASLTGKPLETGTSRFTALADRKINTFMSVVATKPEQFTVRELRRGDMFTVEGVWPTLVRLSLAIVPSTERTTLFDAADVLGPVGLVAETPSQFVVNLEGYGHSVLLLGQISTSDEAPLEDLASVTVSAYPEPVKDDAQAPPSTAHVLWNADARNPVLGYDYEFIWEANRDSKAYRSSYVRRFNRLPPWHPASGTHREMAYVAYHRALQRLFRRG
jgi:hypothetical protein